MTKSPNLQQIGKQLPVTNEVTDHLAHLNIRYLYNDKLSKSVGKSWGTEMGTDETETNKLNSTRLGQL